MLIKIRNMGKIDNVIIDGHNPIVIVGPNRQAKSTMLNAFRFGITGGLNGVTKKDMITLFKYARVNITEGALDISREIRSSITGGVTVSGKQSSVSEYYKTNDLAINQALYVQDFLESNDRKKYFSQLSLLGDKIESPFEELDSIDASNLDLKSLEVKYSDLRRTINADIKAISSQPPPQKNIMFGNTTIDLSTLDLKKDIEDKLTKLRNAHSKLAIKNTKPKDTSRPSPEKISKIAEDIASLNDKIGKKSYTVSSDPVKFENRIAEYEKEIVKLKKVVWTKKKIEEMEKATVKPDDVIQLGANSMCPCLCDKCPVDNAEEKNTNLLKEMRTSIDEFAHASAKLHEEKIRYERYNTLTREVKAMKENLETTKLVLERMKKEKELRELNDALHIYDKYKNHPTEEEKEKELVMLQGRIKHGEELMALYRSYIAGKSNRDELKRLKDKSERYTKIIDYVRHELPQIITLSAIGKIEDRLALVNEYLNAEIVFDDELNVAIKHGELIVPERFFSKSERILVSFFIQDAILKETNCPIIILDDIDALDPKYKFNLLKFISENCANFYKMAIFCSKTDSPKEDLTKLPFDNIDLYYMFDGTLELIEN